MNSDDSPRPSEDVRPAPDELAPATQPGVLTEVVRFLRDHKWLWLLPLVLLIIAVLLLLAVEDSAIAPFIYRHY